MPNSLTTKDGANSRLSSWRSVPNFEFAERKYLVKFAGTAEEVDAALKLRFEVFNLELGEGLDTSFATQRDRDEFDEQCHHLLVMERRSGLVIGTYRMQTREMAAAGNGFYSAGEFQLACFPEAVLKHSVEVGRACIAREHRNGRVLFLLWKGIAGYISHFQKRYLFGCCSLTSQDPDEGKRVMDFLDDQDYRSRKFAVPPQPGLECYPPNFVASSYGRVKLPQLFQIYLNYGAKVCGEPAIDRLFKTIDYLVLLDVAALDEQTYKMFFK